MIKSKSLVFFLFLMTSLSLMAGEMYDPIAIYLTWQRSPDSTMTVNWITQLDRVDDTIEYKPQGSEEWKKVKGTHSRMPEGYPYLIHTTELTELTPSTDYRFRTGFDSFEYKFRTLDNKLDEPLTFVVGGDIYQQGIEPVTKMNKEIAKRNPSFAIVGGDLAYSFLGRINFTPEKVQRWIDWLSNWKQTMIDSSGRFIPMLAVIGNHEVKGGYDKTPAQAPSFYALFSAMPGPQGYNLLDFGNYLTILLLDSGHTHPIEGEQQSWVYYALKDREQFPHKFAVYHVPAYPCVRRFDDGKGPSIRKYWVPIFEEFGLSAAFEHNDHAYKRTYPLKGGKADAKGVLYIGDGGWGIPDPRRPRKPSEVPYLAKSIQSANVLFVTIYPNNKRYYQSIDSNGNIIDEYWQP